MTEIVTQGLDTPILPIEVPNPHPYLSQLPDKLNELTILVCRLGQLTGQKLTVQPLCETQGRIIRDGEALPLMRYYTLESAIERVDDAISMLENLDGVIFGAGDWMSELESFETGDQGWE